MLSTAHLFEVVSSAHRAIARDGPEGLPAADNTPGALQRLLAYNQSYRSLPWPEPFNTTSHRILEGDARDLSDVPNESVHLVVTSPPYWTLKKYNNHPSQMGDIEDYDTFLKSLDQVWRECERVLVPGGRVCCVVGDVCLPRKKNGRHEVIPLHADIQVRCRKLGLMVLTPILWHKIANGSFETEGNGSGFYGKPYQPGGIVKNDVEYILFMRKGGRYRSVSQTAKALSMINKDEMQRWFRSIWTDVPGESTRQHPAPYPVELAERLIRMFSFAGDVVLDPFLGTASTTLAAMRTGRHSIGVEIDPNYLDLIEDRLAREAAIGRRTGATSVLLSVMRKTK